MAVSKDPVVEEYKKHVDTTLLDRSLAMTPEQRLNRLFELQQLARELREAGQRAKQ